MKQNVYLFLFFILCLIFVSMSAFAFKEKEKAANPYNSEKGFAECLKISRHIEDNWNNLSLEEIYHEHSEIGKNQKEVLMKIYGITQPCANILIGTKYKQEMESVYSLDKKILEMYSPADAKKLRKLSNHNKPLCESLLNFLYPTGTLLPSRECWYLGDASMIARQVVPSGIIVYSINGSFKRPRYILLSKDNSIDRETVDNGHIAEGIFEYEGISSINGETLYSFRRVK